MRAACVSRAGGCPIHAESAAVRFGVFLAGGAEFQVGRVVVTGVAVAVMHFFAAPQIAPEDDGKDCAMETFIETLAHLHPRIPIRHLPRERQQDAPSVLGIVEFPVPFAQALQNTLAFSEEPEPARARILDVGGRLLHRTPPTADSFPASPAAMHATNDSAPACAGGGQCASCNSSCQSSTGAT